MDSVVRVCVIFVLFAVNGYYCSRVVEVGGVETVLAVENEDLVIGCEDDAPIAYCGFTHPNATRYAFSGANLNSGQCHLRLRVVQQDSGRWTCHIGRKDAPGEELTQIKNVLVGGELTALERNVTGRHGSPVTLACTTARALQPLSYCRFVPPSGNSFSINSDITPNNSIRGRLYYPAADRSVDRGDCAVTLARAAYEDAGEWLCGAWIEGGDREFSDTVLLTVQGLYTISSISVVAIIFSVVTVVIIIFVAVFITWKKREGNPPATPREDIEIRELERLRRSISLPRSRSVSPQRDVPQINIQSPSDGSAAATPQREGAQQ